MSRPTLSTGSIDLAAGKQETKSRRQPVGGRTTHCHIAVLADFSGRSHRGLNDADSVTTRKILAVDRDNFDDIFAHLHVTFDSPLADSAIEFNELDDLHPDYLYQRIPAFDNFKSLRRRLKNNSTFAGAAAEIQSWSGQSETAATVHASANPASQHQADSDASQCAASSLLDQLLAEPVVRQTTGQPDVKRLVREIMAPYIIPGPDPRQQQLLTAVDEAASQLMRRVLHNSDFQKIEASWRSLYLLTKRLTTDAQLKIFVIDISQQELTDDAAAWSNARSGAGQQQESGGGALKKLLLESRSAAGMEPFAMIMADYQFGDLPGHVQAISYLAEIGMQSGAAVLTGGSESIAGCQSLALAADPDDWHYQPAAGFVRQWQDCRESAASQWLALIAPRFMLRLPYGKKLSRTENFAFEELPVDNPHHYYLWANGAWLATILLAQTFSEFGWNFKPGQQQRIDRLPIHVFEDEDGDTQVTPCAEVYMTDRAASRLIASGIMPVRSVYQQDGVLLPDFISVHCGDSLLQGPWSRTLR